MFSISIFRPDLEVEPVIPRAMLEAAVITTLKRSKSIIEIHVLRHVDRQSLKTLLFSSDNISVLSALEVLTIMRYINRHFTYLLAYLDK